MRFPSLFCGERPKRRSTLKLATRKKILTHITQPDNPLALGIYLADKKDLSSDPMAMGSDYLKITVTGPEYVKHVSILLHHGANPHSSAVYTAAMGGSSHDIIALLFSYGMPYRIESFKPPRVERKWCQDNYKALHRLSKRFKSLNQQLRSGTYKEMVETYGELEQLITNLPEDISRDVYSYAIGQYTQKLQDLQDTHEESSSEESNCDEYRKLLKTR